MNVEILSIGTELLVGSILDTNARFLCQKLAENAINVFYRTTVGDNIERIVKAFEEASERADILITSGGLGPTEDDVTVRALGRFLQEPLVLHKPTYRFIRERLKERRYSMTRLIARQCYLPRSARVMPNKRGTAPALLCEYRRGGCQKWLLVLPGPPRELEPLFTQTALPLLIRCARIKKEHFMIRSVKIAGAAEVDIARKVPHLLKMKPPITVGIYATPGEVELKIMAKTTSHREAKKKVSHIERDIRSRLKKLVYGTDSDTLSSVVGELLKNLGATLSAAESCTGGLLSSVVTQTPGSSRYFLGSIVSYSNHIKTRELGISPALIKKHGAVSDSVASQMAESIRRMFGSDYGIGITGIAGPGGGTTSKPVGLVYIALSGRQGVVCERWQFFGSRQEIRSRAVSTALNRLRILLLDAT